ncbi:MAG: glycine cleavage system protein GcvH [Deltaproteobacteria bacterium]|nr:glycine cleavage system protein GcvH [Deltaproteobacteria bacterium]
MPKPELKFSRDHLWVRVKDDTATIGISDYAQEELGEIVFAEIPEISDEIDKGESFGEIESTKTVTELLAPISGTVTEINRNLENNPALINEDPYGSGWLIEIEPLDLEELGDLMSPEEYDSYIEEK